MQEKEQAGRWPQYSDARGADAGYEADRRRAQAELSATEAGPGKTPELGRDTKNPHGEFEAPGASGDLARHGAARPAPKAGSDIRHPQSPREDAQFAAIHDRQDALLRKDSSPGATGDTDPAANAKPPGPGAA